MIIEKITIKSFGKLKDLTMEFSEGINVIEGQNEAGKSTIAAFIRYMLYGFDTPAASVGQDDDKPDERHKRLNWENGTANGSMVARVKDKRYLITRSTTPSDGGVAGRSVFKEDASIIDMETGAPVFGKLPAGEVFFGVDRELFENTAFIGQIGETGIREDSVRESIENILFSGNEKLNTQKAIETLKSKMETLYHEGRTGGLIFDLSQQKARLEETLVQTDEDNKQILVKEAELFDIRKKRDEAIKKQEKLYDADQCYHNVMLIQTFDRLHELEKENEEKTEAYNAAVAANTVNGFVPDEAYLAQLKAERKNVNERYQNLIDAEEHYAKEKSAVGITREIESAIERTDQEGGEAALKEKARALHVSMIRSIAMMVLCGLLAITAEVLELTGILHVFGHVIGALAVLGAGFMLFLLLAAQKRLRAMNDAYRTATYADLLNKLQVIGEAREKRDRILASTDSALLAMNAAKEAYTKAKEDLRAVILRWDPSPAAEKGNEYLDALEEKVRAFLEEKKRLSDEKTNSDITVFEIRRTLADQSEIDIRAQVPPIKRKVLSGINHEEITSGIAETKNEIASLDKLAFDKENELADLKVRARDPGELYSRIQVLERRIAEQRAKHRAYFLAAKSIEHAEAQLREEISPRLGAYATNLMQIMTNKKYSDLSVSDGLRVCFMQDGEQKSVDFLSGSTRDMTYIAVRMALIDMLYTENPPVCFDESFAHQDNVRARYMMQAIAYLSETKEQQSFIFTCRSRETTLASDISSGTAVFKLTSKKNS